MNRKIARPARSTASWGRNLPIPESLPLGILILMLTEMGEEPAKLRRWRARWRYPKPCWTGSAGRPVPDILTPAHHGLILNHVPPQPVVATEMPRGHGRRGWPSAMAWTTHTDEWLILEAPGAGAKAIPRLFPHPLQDPGIVVAICQIVVEGGETMTLAGLLHLPQLTGFKLGRVNISPVVTGGIHGEAGSYGAIGADNDVVLSGAAVPFGKVHLAVGLLHDAVHRNQQLGDVVITMGAVAVPAQLFQVRTRGHAQEGLHLPQALHRIHHLVTGAVLLDQPVNEFIHLPPVLGTNVGGILLQMFEMLILLQHGGFIDVIVGGHA